MSLFDYQQAKDLHKKDYSFKSLIMAAFWRADEENGKYLKEAFPVECAELRHRMNSKDGRIGGEVNG